MSRLGIVEVTLDDFDDEDILEAAKEIGFNRDVETLANAAYVSIITGNEADEKAICRKLIGEILGKVI